MSIILDALNRSESERTAPDAVPGLHTVHGSPDPSANPAWRKFAWPAAVVLLAALALFPWLLDREPEAVVSVGPSPAQSPAAGVQPIVRSPVSTPDAESRQSAVSAPEQQGLAQAGADSAPVPSLPATEVAAGAAVASEDIAALYQSRETAVDAAPAPGGAAATSRGGAGQTDAPAAAAEAAPARAAPARAAPASPAPARAAPAPATPDPDPALVDAMTRAAEQGLLDISQTSSQAPIEHPAPYLSELRQSQKDQIPSIFYSSHNWATNPAQRSVILNGEEKRAGQQVKPGLRLEEILEDSIVLSFQGTEFRLRSLNSWVNL